MKKVFVAVAVLSLTTFALAQKAAPSQHLRGNPNGKIKMAPPGTPPALCSPCLFYGGDLVPSNLNAAGMSDENTLLISDGGGSTYGAVDINKNVVITGILFNVQASAAFDPQTATYDIRSGVTDGNGGTDIATGSGTVQVATTGRNFLGLNEFTVEVPVTPPQVLAPGTYWFNVQPQCTNTLDGSCSVGRIFVSNTLDGVNNVAGTAQPAHQMYFNSAYFGFTYSNWCDSALGFNSMQCGLLSFGLVGSAD